MLLDGLDAPAEIPSYLLVGVSERNAYQHLALTRRHFEALRTGRQLGRPPTNLSPDFVWESKGHLTPFGYEVVIRIPPLCCKSKTGRPRRSARRS